MISVYLKPRQNSPYHNGQEEDHTQYIVYELFVSQEAKYFGKDISEFLHQSKSANSELILVYRSQGFHFECNQVVIQMTSVQEHSSSYHHY